MAEPDLTCPHCGTVSPAFTEFCPSCRQRLTCVRPESRTHRVLRALGFVKQAGAPQRNAVDVAEVYRRAPMHHDESR